MEGRAEGDGKDLAISKRLAQARLELLGRQRALVEVSLHQLVVGLGDPLDELVAPLFDCVLELRRGVRGFGLAVAVSGVAVGLAVDQIDHAFEIVLPADRHLERDDRLAEVLAERLEHPLEVRVVAVHLVDMEQNRLTEAFGVAPHPLGRHLDAGDGVDHQHGGVGGADGGTTFEFEHPRARGVEDVDLVLAPGHEARRQGDRVTALDLLGIEVGGGIAVLHPLHAVDRAAGVEQSAGDRGLAGVGVTREGDVPDHARVIDLHLFPP